MAIYTSTITISMLIMLMFSVVTSAEDMSIISYNEEHHTKGGKWRTDEEIMALYESWLVENKKVYNALGEKDKRFLVFKDNLKYIDEMNAIPDKTYKLGLTKFADLTNEEFKSMYLATMPEDASILSNITQSDRYAPKVGDSCLPCFVDWRKKGVLVGVKDQEECGGSGWAFAAVSTIEAINQMVTGQLIVFSEQHLIDCETTYSNGCKGGFVNRAFEFVTNNGGLDVQFNYPYIAQKGTCNENAIKYVTIDGYESVPANNEMALKKAVTNQPVAVYIDASSIDFQLYKKGIFTGSCGTESNHAVAAVGYGISEDGMEFWTVRNSWGTNWGEGGHIKMQRNIDSTAGLCGIAKSSFYPIKTGPNPPNICTDLIAYCPPGLTCRCFNSNCLCFDESNLQLGTSPTSKKAPMKNIHAKPIGAFPNI